MSFFPYYSMTGWVAGPWHPPLLLFLLLPLPLSQAQISISPPIYSFCLAAPPILSPALLLAIQFFIRQPGVLGRQSNTALQS